MDCDTLQIQRGENPDIVFEFLEAKVLETDPDVPLDLTGAAVTVTSTLPEYANPVFQVVDPLDGIVLVEMPEAVTLAMKGFTEYKMVVRVVDADAGIHIAELNIELAK